MKKSPVLPFIGLLLAFLLLLVAPPAVSGNGFRYRGFTIVGFKIAGRVACSLSPNPPANSPGIGRVNVTLTCNGSSTSLGSVVTDPKGFFDTIATAIDGISTDNSELPCVATVKLPPNLSCSVFPPKATIRATLDLVGTVVQLAIGLVAEVTTSAFTLV